MYDALQDESKMKDIEEIITGHCNCCNKDSVFKYVFTWKEIQELDTYYIGKGIMYNCLKCGTTKSLHNIEECTKCNKNKPLDYQI